MTPLKLLKSTILYPYIHESDRVICKAKSNDVSTLTAGHTGRHYRITFEHLKVFEFKNWLFVQLQLNKTNKMMLQQLSTYISIVI